MFFNIRYRSKDGRISHLEIEAENKAAVWPELKRLGINAISISEGKASAKEKGGSASSQSLRMSLFKYALVIVPIIAVGLYFLINLQKSEQDTAQLIKSEESKPTVKIKKTKSPPTTSKEPKPSTKDNPRSALPPQNLKAIKELQSENKDDSTNAVEEVKKPKKKVVFTNPMDQLMAMVMPREPGDAVPPVPISDDMEFTPEQEKQMFERLTAEDDDSEAILERKELVQAMRNEYAELKTKHGWKFVDYIKALEAKARLDNEVLTESVTIHETIFNDPNISDEQYLKTLGKINKVLAERGIKEISVPTEEENEQPTNHKENK
jgi:hypothetical protein